MISIDRPYSKLKAQSLKCVRVIRAIHIWHCIIQLEWYTSSWATSKPPSAIARAQNTSGSGDWSWNTKAGQLSISAHTDALWQCQEMFPISLSLFLYLSIKLSVVIINNFSPHTFLPQYHLLDTKISAHGNAQCLLYSIVCLQCLALFLMLFS